MQIIWYGQSFFQILTQKSKEKVVKIAIDPFDEKIGFKVPSLEFDILLVTHSHSDHNNLKAIKGSFSQISEKPGRTSPFLISGPGEYEIGGVFIQGISAFHDNAQGKERLQPSQGRGVSLRESASRPDHPRGPNESLGGWREGRSPAFGGPLGENTIYTLESEGIKICHLGNLGQKELTDEQLERIGDVDILMIPVGGVYTISAKEATKIISQIEPKIVIPMHYQIPKLKIKLEGLDKFLKIMGVKSPEVSKKLTIQQKNLPAEGMKILILKP